MTTPDPKPCAVKLKEYFDFLDELRESAVTNMWAASPYLADEFELPIKDASKILGGWMQTFDLSKTMDERVSAFTRHEPQVKNNG